MEKEETKPINVSEGPGHDRYTYDLSNFKLKRGEYITINNLDCEGVRF